MDKKNLEIQENIGQNLEASTQNIKKIIQSKNYDANDLRFMSSLSEAVLAKAPSGSRKILYIVAITVFWLVVCADRRDHARQRQDHPVGQKSDRTKFGRRHNRENLRSHGR